MQTAATMEIVIVIVVLNFLFFIFSRPFFSDFFHSITFLFVCIDLSRTIFDLSRIIFDLLRIIKENSTLC